MRVKGSHEIHKTAIISKKINIKGDGKLSIGAYTSIEDNVFIDLGQSGEVKIADRCNIKYGSVIRCYGGKIVIGKRSSIGEYTILAGHGGLIIGNAVIIAGHCYLSASEHIFYGEDPIRFQGETSFGINILDGAWLGARTTILDGVTVGSGCIVGASSLVTKNLKNNYVCIGVPCKEQYKRNQF